MKKHNFRKGLLAASALVLVAAISVGATLAYLTASSREVTNTFTAGEGINITLTEPDYEGDGDYTPGSTITKNPQVNNTSVGDSPVYVVASLSYYIDNTEVSYATFTNSADDDDVIKYATIYSDTNATAVGFNSAWTQIADDDVNKDYFVYGTAVNAPTSVAKGDSTASIFEKVKISEKDKAGTTYKIVVNAYAVNADNGTTDVYTELASLVNDKSGDTLSLSGTTSFVAA